MPITVECPGCGRKYAATEKLAGRTLACKQCGGSISVPAPAPEPAPRSGARLRVACDQCGTPHLVAAEHAGKKTICAKCGARFRIPGDGASTGSTGSASTPRPSRAAPSPVSPPPVDPDIYGLNDEPVALPPRSAIGSLEAPASRRSGGADPDALPTRLNYEPLSAAKKKRIAKRAAKADRTRPSNATVGVSFGAVLAIALFGWRVSRLLGRFERAASRANAAQTAPADDFDPKAALLAQDKEVEEMIAQPSTAEARDWLDAAKFPNHGVMEMPIEAAREMVAGFYERGAERVSVLDPTTIGNSVITAQIAVKLPQDSAHRKQCLEWAAKYDEGAPPSPDHGQKYILITTD